MEAAASETRTRREGSRPPSGQHIDVVQAETDFQKLERTLSRYQNSTEKHPKVLEAADAEQTFDLREYLSSSNDASNAAGIKHKHVGVTWEDLEVQGIGGIDDKVSEL